MTRYDMIRHDKTHVSCKGHDMTQKDTKIFLEKNIFFSEIYFLIIPFLKIIEHIMRFLYIPLMPNLNFQKIFFKVFKKIIYTIFVSFRVVSCHVIWCHVVSFRVMSCHIDWTVY